MRYWWAYLTGYVLLAVDGLNPERLLNLALNRGVALWDVRWSGRERLFLKVRARDLFPLRHIARAAGCRLRIVAKRGCPFAWGRLQRRRAFLGGLVFFFLSLYVAGSFIWVVEVRLPEQAKYNSRRLVLEEAAALGLRPGAWRPGLDPNALAAELAQRLPNVSWIGVHLKGIRATIEVVERVLPGAGVRAAHIVAAKDGVVEDVLVLRGEARVKAGDVVRRGQILISGIVAPAEGQGPTLVRAEGRVKARVWYEAYASVPLVERREVGTGRAETAYSLHVGSHVYHLWGPRASPYRLYKVEKVTESLPALGPYRLPVHLTKVTYREVRREEIKRTVSQGQELARARAEELLRSKVPADARVLGYRVEQVYGDGTGEVVVRALAETAEDIGRAYPLVAN